jgi:Asp-tRNA(Asn)/Glu-tRNA(Gln) amidotransferase B subunit
MASADRLGRGRLSSLDMAPDEAQDDIFWAMGELNARKRTQAEILSDLNGRLADKNCPLISKSAFNRKAMRVAAAASRLAERRALFEGLAPQFTAERMDEANVVIGELIKTLITEMLDADAGTFTPKGAMELARALKHSVEAQTISSEAKRRALDAASRKVGEAVEKVAKEKGITAETRAKIMEQLGVIRRGEA